MLARWQFWVTTVVALIVAVVAGYVMMLAGQNRAAAAELSSRMQNASVQKAVQLEPLYREIVKSLADLSVRNQDKSLTDLLATQGITINPAVPSATPDTPAASAPTGAPR